VHSSTPTASDRQLVRAGYLFLAGSALHTFDHLRRGQGSVTELLNRVGTIGVVVQVVVITLILTRHRLAPLMSAGAGFALALGFAAAHWLPHWSSLSDSFVDHRVSAFSYVASVAEIVGAVAVGIAGTRAYLERTITRRSDEPGNGLATNA
jgi:asparagine N-glycosylation enzyme membrane subunit Stt3